MQFNGFAPDVSWMREELTDLGVTELRTPEEVDAAMKEAQQGSTLLIVNSVCGCAAGNARPGVKMALDHNKLPDRIYTVFAGQDKEATAQARSYFPDFPPSSPSFTFFKDGDVKAVIPRQRVEGRSSTDVANDLKMVFDAFCEEVAS